MMLSELPLYLALGAFAGWLAGLLGVGGGLIIVPVLVWLFGSHGISHDVSMHLALGTSLATIVFTSVASVRTHHAHGAVDWHLLRRIIPGVMLGTLLGSVVAAQISGYALQLFFVAFLLFVAVQMWFEIRPKPHYSLPGLAGLSAAGGVIGLVSSLVGIGGGTLSVPFQLWCNVDARRAIGTSAAIGVPIAIAGMAGYVLNGWGARGLPPGSLGYVYLPALGGIVLASVLTAAWGARMAHRLPVKTLKKGFALLLFVLALRMALTL